MLSASKVLNNLMQATLEPVLDSFGGLAALLSDFDSGLDGTLHITTESTEKSPEALWAQLSTESHTPSEEEIRECFDQIDADSDGRITLAELTSALRNDRDFLHIMLPNLGAKAMMHEIGLEMLGNPLMAGLGTAGCGINLDVTLGSTLGKLPEHAN